MREDVANLLQGIGQADFPYREFEPEQASASYGFWPLFEAVSLHPALARRAWARVHKAPLQRTLNEGPGQNRGFLSAYEPGKAGDARAAQPADDVRGLLRRLSDQIK